MRPTAPALAVAVLLATLCGCGERGAALSVLPGKWLRPDGGYVLEVKSVSESGALDAAYFNPGPIHVALAKAFREAGSLKVFIELRDVNYPGSTYTLKYDEGADRLEGTYYQAVAKETYEIWFERMKP